MKMVLKNSDSDQIDPTICLLRIQLPTLKSNGFYDRNSISRSDDAIENDPQSSHLPVAQTSSNNSFDPKRILDPQFDDDSPLISSKSSRNPNRIFQKLSNQSLCSSSSSSFRSDTISLWSSIFFCSIRLKSNWFCEKSIRLKSNQSILIFVIIFILLSSSLQNARATSSQTSSTSSATASSRSPSLFRKLSTPKSLNDNRGGRNVGGFRSGVNNTNSSNQKSLSTSSSTTIPSFFGTFLFEPNVQAQCERNLMQISVQFDQPFTGIVHVKNFRRDPCQIYGNGSTSLSLTIDLLAGHNRPNYCGVYRTKGSEERSISLVVRLHRALELSDDKHFVITCGNTEFNNRNRNEKLLLKFVDQNGNKINKLYHGESYRLRAEIVSSSSSSQNQQLSSSRSSSSSSSSPSLSSYHLYVHNCFIFNGNDSDVEFLDSNGCPALTSVGPFKQISRNVAESDIQSMFKLPGTNQLHLQCLIKMIENCTTCQQSFCPINQTRSQSQELISSKKNNAKTKTEMQMLASTTVYVFEPDQQMSSSILYAGGIGGGLGFNGGGNNGHNFDGRCTEWRFPWLIALCIMLGILLIIMMVVNIFLCSSLSCSCCRSEIVEHEPVIIEDYDPYKIDIGSFYSPYDSRLSLNRSSKLLPFSSSSSTAHHNCGNGGGVCPGVCSNHDRSGHYCSSAHQTQSVLSLPAPQSTQSHQSSSSSSQNQQHQQQQQQQQQHSQHHHHHHNNQNHPLMPLTANSSTAIKPISISSSYSPSIETTNNNNSNLRGRLLMNGLNGNNLKINKSNLKKLGKSASKQTKQLGKQSMMMMMPPAIAYNPYQHSPQSIRSEEFY